jgi:hypothetical protein
MPTFPTRHGCYDIQGACAGLPTLTLPRTERKHSRLPDKDLISDYAVKGFEMTPPTEIMIGNAQGKLNPKGNATRAEAAIVLYRLFNTVY